MKLFDYLGALLILLLLYTSFGQPANDQCSNATDLGAFTDGQNITLTGQSNVDATGEMGYPVCNHDDPTTLGVWYKLTVTLTARVIVSTCNQANFDTMIAVYGGSDCGSLVCQDGVDDTAGCGKTTRITAYIEPQEIYILVNGYDGSRGNFQLTVSVTAYVPIPNNDRCSDATDLGVFTDGRNVTLTDQYNIGATDDKLEAPDCFGGPDVGVWYKLSVAFFPARIEVSTCHQADFDTQIAIYGSGSGGGGGGGGGATATCGSLVCQMGADDGDGCGSSTTRVVIATVEPQNIYIFVNGYQGDMGHFNLTVSVTFIPPPNDRCSDAMDLGSFTDGQNITVTGQSNMGATDDKLEAPWCVKADATLGVWYKLTVAFPARVAVSTCNQADFDTMIAVYSGMCGSLVCQAGVDDTVGCGKTTRATGYVDTQGDIYILVNGFFETTGNFNLTVKVFTLPNGRCSDATDLGSLTNSQNITVTDQSNAGAKDVGLYSPICDDILSWAGVWYKFSVAFPATAEVSTCNQADFDTQIRTFSGACDLLACEYGADDADGCAGYTTRLVVDIRPQDLYYIFVFGYFGYTGIFQLTVSICFSETLEGDVFGSVIYFNGGETLPPGSYTVSYIGGCVQYGSTQPTWDVNVYSGGPSWYLVARTTTERIINLPPTRPSNPYNSFEECVNGNLGSTSDVVFSLGKASVVGIWFDDSSYLDNTAGHPSPTWKLECNERAGTPVPQLPPPSLEPSLQPSVKPSAEASMRPSVEPSSTPSSSPSWEPSWTPSVEPSLKPSVQLSMEPTLQPSIRPSADPSAEASAKPSMEPSLMPSSYPFAKPSMVPSLVPSWEPSWNPTVEPSLKPSIEPSPKPFRGTPTRAPVPVLTAAPGVAPTLAPIWSPTLAPAAPPTRTPTRFHTRSPTLSPIRSPTREPTRPPTWEPTPTPTFKINCDTDDFKIIELDFPAYEDRKFRCYDFYFEPSLCDAMSSDQSRPAWLLCPKQCWKRSQCPPVTASPTKAAAPVSLPAPGPTTALGPTNASPVAHSPSAVPGARPPLVNPQPPRPPTVPLISAPVLHQLPPSVLTITRQPSAMMLPVSVPTDDRVWIPLEPPQVPSFSQGGAKTSVAPNFSPPTSNPLALPAQANTENHGEILAEMLPSHSPSLKESNNPPGPLSGKPRSMEPASTFSPITDLDRTVTSQPPIMTSNENTLPVVSPNVGSWTPSHAPSSRLPNKDNESFDEIWVKQVKLKLMLESRLARRLNHVDILAFERIVADICKECYASSGGSSKDNNVIINTDRVEKGRHRHLQDPHGRRRDPRDVIDTKVVFVRQELVYDDNEMPMRIIVYDQYFLFKSQPQGQTSDVNKADNQEMYIPPLLATLPFNETAWNMRMGTELKENVQALHDIKLPLEVPYVPDQAQFLLKSEENDSKKGLSQAMIAGIFAVAALTFTGVAIYALRQMDLALAIP